MSLTSDLELFKNSVAVLKKMHRKQLDAANEESKQKRLVSKQLADLLNHHELPYGTEIRIEDEVYSYKPSIKEVVPEEKWLALYEEGEISREKFLSAISVSKSAADKAAGQDIVIRMLEKEVGKKSDLRVEPYSGVWKNTIEIIRKTAKIKPRITLKRVALKPVLKRQINITRR